MTDWRIANLPLPVFMVVAAVLAVAILLGVLPAGMIGALALIMVVGGLFAFAGDHTPIVKDYLGGAPLVCIFGAAALVHFRILPERGVI